MQIINASAIIGIVVVEFDPDDDYVVIRNSEDIDRLVGPNAILVISEDIDYLIAALQKAKEILTT